MHCHIAWDFLIGSSVSIIPGKTTVWIGSCLFSGFQLKKKTLSHSHSSKLLPFYGSLQKLQPGIEGGKELDRFVSFLWVPVEKKTLFHSHSSKLQPFYGSLQKLQSGIEGGGGQGIGIDFHPETSEK